MKLQPFNIQAHPQNTKAPVIFNAVVCSDFYSKASGETTRDQKLKMNKCSSTVYQDKLDHIKAFSSFSPVHLYSYIHADSPVRLAALFPDIFTSLRAVPGLKYSKILHLRLYLCSVIKIFSIRRVPRVLKEFSFIESKNKILLKNVSKHQTVLLANCK